MKDPAVRSDPGSIEPVSSPRPQGVGMAMRMSTELASAVFVGGGIGYLLDYWFKTDPWLTLVFFLFGLAAGFRDMYRFATRQEAGREATSGESIRPVDSTKR